MHEHADSSPFLAQHCARPQGIEQRVAHRVTSPVLQKLGQALEALAIYGAPFRQRVQPWVAKAPVRIAVKVRKSVHVVQHVPRGNDAISAAMVAHSSRSTVGGLSARLNKRLSMKTCSVRPSVLSSGALAATCCRPTLSPFAPGLLHASR